MRTYQLTYKGYTYLEENKDNFNLTFIIGWLKLIENGEIYWNNCFNDFKRRYGWVGECARDKCLELNLIEEG
jgi:hypothetical protein